MGAECEKLDDLCKAYLGRSKIEFDFKKIKNWTDVVNNRDEISKYNGHDSELTADLYKIFIEKLCQVI
jgi:hypothetical protein